MSLPHVTTHFFTLPLHDNISTSHREHPSKSSASSSSSLWSLSPLLVSLLHQLSDPCCSLPGGCGAAYEQWSSLPSAAALPSPNLLHFLYPESLFGPSLTVTLRPLPPLANTTIVHCDDTSGRVSSLL